MTFAFGEEYKGSKVDVFRSAGVYTDMRTSYYNQIKKLEQIGTYKASENGDLTLEKISLFSPIQGYSLVRSKDGTLFLRVTKINGEQLFRWMDIRDFNIPYWQGHEKHVTMSFNLASGKDDPNNFNWQIEYSDDNSVTP